MLFKWPSSLRHLQHNNYRNTTNNDCWVCLVQLKCSRTATLSEEKHQLQLALFLCWNNRTLIRHIETLRDNDDDSGVWSRAAPVTRQRRMLMHSVLPTRSVKNAGNSDQFYILQYLAYNLISYQDVSRRPVTVTPLPRTLIASVQQGKLARSAGETILED